MRYVRPDESVMFSPVTGTVDADYQADWLVDGRSTRPAQVTGNLDLDVVPPTPVMVGVVALINYAGLDTGSPASVTLAGSLSDSIEIPALPPDDIPPVAFTLIDPPVSVSTLTIQATAGGSPASPISIGELYAGTLRTLEWPLLTGQKRDPAVPFDWEGEAGSLPPYDPGIADPVRLTGQTWLTDTGLAEMEAWYKSTKRGSRPTLILPPERPTEALLGTFRYSIDSVWVDPDNPLTSLHHVTFEFVERSRVRPLVGT